MLCTTSASPLRAAVLSSRVQSAPFQFSSAFSTTSRPFARKFPVERSPASITVQPWCSTATSFSSSANVTPVRILTRYASSSSTSTSARSTSSASTEPAEGKLDWNTFLHLRKVRRRYNLAASIGSSITTTIVGMSVLSQQDLDLLNGQYFGLDPFVILGLVTAGFGALGWLAGPFLGNAIFKIAKSKQSNQFAIKEKEFYNRIKRYRVDPSSQSFSNPVPDYYGEKIGSVQGYRQWLKDQRAYNKKKQSFL
ncbi:Pam17-domain-containing protein [Xylona heveae TC161]|uniref:Presequence translocated-associated motor subunit PAM17 n=1 Tax=Xylona heveae (strain CBS 132557 / TC161) TaxID=1328760 RepID=A0A165JXY5_XYLHT|nr:Pam17-domain-containing protein [Xylona heveae TC161]KZF26765.1 Pam17-domain-containing protein [Xylona heveae TC161]